MNILCEIEVFETSKKYNFFRSINEYYRRNVQLNLLQGFQEKKEVVVSLPSDVFYLRCGVDGFYVHFSFSSFAVESEFNFYVICNQA